MQKKCIASSGTYWLRQRSDIPVDEAATWVKSMNKSARKSKMLMPL